MATATLTQEICENCSRLGKLELSITGKQKLCKKCMIEQFEYYKQQRIQYCGDMEKVAEYYKRKIGTGLFCFVDSIYERKVDLEKEESCNVISQ